jgi:hypothetical protein
LVHNGLTQNLNLSFQGVRRSCLIPLLQLDDRLHASFGNLVGLFLGQLLADQLILKGGNCVGRRLLATWLNA